jgi:HEPN domain-containing protein
VHTRIRIQADDFFKAYQTLKQSYDTASLAVMGPSIVCLAFSIELYLKEAYCLLNKELPRGHDGHDILKLFQGLPEEIQQEIFSHEAIISQSPWPRGDIFSPKRYTEPPSAFDGFLYGIQVISKGFTDWRYSHEKKSNLRYNSDFAGTFITAVKSVSDGIKGKNRKAS